MSLAKDGMPCAGWPWRLLAAGLIVAAAALRLAYLAADCPLDLAPDEAHYWDWSRHLDWSYYSKGPLVAYLIRAGCAVAGAWSQQQTGSEELAVRLPAVVCGSLLLVSVYVLTVQVFGREKLAWAAVALALTLPLVSAGSSLMTIDAPYACCWGWALVLGHHAVCRRAAWAWPAAGLVVGLGILAKYTMIVWLPSVALFLLTSPDHRRLLFRPGFWVMAGIAAVCCLPIVVWNAQHHWVSLRHVGGQAGVGSGLTIRWLGPVEYVGVQCAVLLGFWFIAWAAALVAHRPTVEADPSVRYLWWMSVPMFAVFLAFSLKTRIQPNWPATAYLSGLVLAGGWLMRRLRSPSRWVRRLTVGGLAAVCAGGMALNVFMHWTDLAYPLLVRLTGPPTDRHPLPLRRLDPTCRLRGWRFLAAEIDQVRAQLRAEGIEPLLAGTGWMLPGELGFYCAGQPAAYSFGPALGERHSQYDLWRPNPVCDPACFAGRTFILVGEVSPLVRAAFDRIEQPRVLTYRVRGQPVASWTVTVCRGFRGFPRPADGNGGRF
jgi:hypothetical protein